MKDLQYLKMRLNGCKETHNCQYVTGKYVGCCNTLVEGFMAVTGSVFRIISSHQRGTSKRLRQGPPSKRTLRFVHSNSIVPIPFTGHLFEILGTETWNCTCNKLENNVEPGKKGCTAAIHIRSVKLYTHTTFGGQSGKLPTKKEQEMAKFDLLQRIGNKLDVPHTIVYYCRFPLLSSHPLHCQMAHNGKISRLDPRIATKIKELALQGVYDLDSVRCMISDYVYQTLFAHAENQELPSPENSRYFPTKRTIQNHIAAAVGPKRKLSGYIDPRKKINQRVDSAIKEEVLRIDRKASKERDSVNDVGMVALHLGAGYHSPDRWPGYKKLCEAALSKAVACIKQGGTAGEAVTIAVKILEDSELTNAGFGSNLTESGQIECDASVMDTSVAQRGGSVTYGAVSCVSRVKNPVEAAHEIAKQQAINRKLALGRIPPCSLSGVGAENWALAHHLQMCDKHQLISESAHKTWQKYSRRLAKQLFQNAKSINGNNTQLPNRSNDDVLELNNTRMDTVGAVALDLRGKVASAASSGGLLMKLPGRVGQAAMFACGCWAQLGSDVTPTVAVTSSGCGEQLIYTTIAKKCAENLQKAEEPYKAVQDTLLVDFLESPFLHTEADRQAGLLTLHLCQQQDGQTTTEVVWGHTTSSMLIGHMSTRDTQPEVLVSRLPNGAVPGKSVSISGTWLKVSAECETADTQEPDTDPPGKRRRLLSGAQLDGSNDPHQSSTRSDSHQNDKKADSDSGESRPMDSSSGAKANPIGQSLLPRGDYDLVPTLEGSMSVMWMSEDAEGLKADDCGVVVAKEFERKEDENFEKVIHSRWTERLAKNPRFFNGSKFRLHSLATSTRLNNKKLTFNVGLTCFRDYMETNWSKDIEQLREIGGNKCQNPQAFLSDPLAIAGVVMTSDQEVIVQRRNHWVAEGAGELDVPGGHPEPGEVISDVTTCSLEALSLRHDDVIAEIFSSSLKEVRDEVNIPMKHLQSPRLMGVVRVKNSGGRPVAYFKIRCDLSSAQVLELYNQGGNETDESTQLLFIPDQEAVCLERLRPDIWSQLCSNGKLAFALHSILHRLKTEPHSASS